MDIVSQVVKKLLKNSITISTAESCTGGLIASEITKYSGVSSIYPGSVISYSNHIKQKVLGVSEETLLSFGAVSESCVKEMCSGVRKLMESDIAVAVSGIAGPSGGTDEKPVGLVFIAVSYHDRVIVEKNIFSGSRIEVQQKTKNRAFEIINKLI